MVAISLGLLLGFLGPFGSNPAYPTTTRYAFWLVLTAAGVLAAVVVNAVLPVTRLRAGAIRIGVLALVSAVPMTVVVAWTMSFLQPGRFFAPQQLPTLFASVAAIQLLIVCATTLIAGSPRDAEAHGRPGALPEQEAGDFPAASPSPSLNHVKAETGSDMSTLEVEAIPAAFPSALLNRLPRAIGNDIIALETEDHYLRVHTTEGSALILMRMADAVALLDPRLGAQVHRRWWVAEKAVTGVRTEGQRLSLRLIDDALVPVGRTFSAAARARFVHARRAGHSVQIPELGEGPAVAGN